MSKKFTTHNDKYIKTGQPGPHSTNKDKTSVPLAQSYEEMIKIFKKVTPAKVSEKERNELIMKANQIFNEGNFAQAHIIFSALNYYSGMVRVAKKYYEAGRVLEAYSIFTHAGADKEAKKIAQDIALNIQHMIKS